MGNLFWDETTHAWTDAADLRIGDQLATPGGGRIDIESVRRYAAPRRTYNLTVDSVHTYYVVAGDTPVLVHNEGDDPSGPEMVRVGRWMSPREYANMQKTGMVQEGAGGATYVVSPANPEACKPTYPGSVYAEFDVPRSSLLPGGRPGDYKMVNPDTLMGRYLAKKGALRACRKRRTLD